MCLTDVIHDTGGEVREARIISESYFKLKKAARKLFVERGYHATRPQDIAREAGLGNGTFYLYFPDKRACFQSFVEEARAELDAHLRSRAEPNASLKHFLATTLNASYEYSECHPGVLTAAMTGDAVIGPEGAQTVPLLQLWGREWAEIVRDGMRTGTAFPNYDPDIIGQAIVGALHQSASEGAASRRSRQKVVESLTHFLVRALGPPRKTARSFRTGKPSQKRKDVTYPI